VTYAPNGGTALQKDLNRLGKLSDSKLIKFKKGKYSVCPWRRIIPYSSIGSGLTICKVALADKRVTMNHQCSLTAKQPNSILGCIRQNTTIRLRDMTLLLCLALVRHIWSAESSAGLPSIRKTGIYWIKCSKGL